MGIFNMASDSEIEADIKLSRHIDDLTKQREVSELVKSMQPLDIAICIQKTFEIVPKRALVITLNLLKNTKLREITTQGTMTNQYPVPTSRKKLDHPNQIPDFSLEEVRRSRVYKIGRVSSRSQIFSEKMALRSKYTIY